MARCCNATRFTFSCFLLNRNLLGGGFGLGLGLGLLKLTLKILYSNGPPLPQKRYTEVVGLLRISLMIVSAIKSALTFISVI